jgi:NADH-quinone oxidoreductase subunit J
MSQATVYTLYLLFALGGLALTLLLPGFRSRKAAGMVFALAALLGLMVLMVVRTDPAAGHQTLFYVLSTIALVAGVRVITHTKPVYSALYFVLVVVATAALLVLQSAEFLAVALIIVYAGAILVTYLFVIMLAQQPTATMYDQQSREPILAVVAGFVAVGCIAGRMGPLPAPPGPADRTVLVSGAAGAAAALPDSNTLLLGATLMTRYVVVLELAGILLLVSMVGAIALSRKRVAADPLTQPYRLGRIGREVEPF